jgi:hypothetical protein
VDPELSTSFCGVQITGDPNVPAGKLTFEVWSQHPLAGPYNGFEEEETFDGHVVEINRPIGESLLHFPFNTAIKACSCLANLQSITTWPAVMHGVGQPVLVNIEERPVAARYFGRGQINADPRRCARNLKCLISYDTLMAFYGFLCSQCQGKQRSFRWHLEDHNVAI